MQVWARPWQPTSSCLRDTRVANFTLHKTKTPQSLRRLSCCCSGRRYWLETKPIFDKPAFFASAMTVATS